jgi:hypothetical protein
MWMPGQTYLAVDLGTSHTVAVVRRDGQLPRTLLFDGSPLLPSGVFVDATGAAHTGRDAQRLARTRPERFEPHPKQRIDDGTVLLGSDAVPVEALLAAVLRRVAQTAREAGVTESAAAVPAVLTCPAGWGQSRRRVLLAAARLASSGLLGDAQLVEEPVAAAAYCLEVLGEQIATGRSLAVFDFGGGTLDVAVVQNGPSGLRVLSSGGLADLGGLDLDAVLVEYLLAPARGSDPELWRRLSGSLPEHRHERQSFWDEVRAAKEMLSRTTVAPVHLPGGRSAIHLTREELERLTSPLVDVAVAATRAVLSSVDGAALAGIFLVGGSSRLPLVASRLHAAFGIAPQVPEQPELPVAHGALLVPRPEAAAAAVPSAAAVPAAAAAPPAAVAERAVTEHTLTARSAPPAVAALRRRRLVWALLAVLVAAAITVAALVVPGLGGSGRESPDSGASNIAGSSGRAEVSTAPSTGPGTVQAVQDFVACNVEGVDLLCPTHPMCWGAISKADPPTATPVDCGARHQWQTFAAGYSSADSGQDLADDPAVKAACNEKVLTARSTAPTDTQDWPLAQIAQRTAGRIVFHCVAQKRGSVEWSGTAFA